MQDGSFLPKDRLHKTSYTLWASYDRTQTIGLDKLVGHVWGDVAKDNATLRQRRLRVRTALNAIGKLEGWTIEPTERDHTIFGIQKPKYV